jgi:hypothetical protein
MIPGQKKSMTALPDAHSFPLLVPARPGEDSSGVRQNEKYGKGIGSIQNLVLTSKLIF